MAGADHSRQTIRNSLVFVPNRLISVINGGDDRREFLSSKEQGGPIELCAKVRSKLFKPSAGPGSVTIGVRDPTGFGFFNRGCDSLMSSDS